MAKDDHENTPNKVIQDHLYGLADSALRKFREKLPSLEQNRYQSAGYWLAEYCVTQSYNHLTAFENMKARSVSNTALIDYCIPIAAQSLGRDWANDVKSFAVVTLGSSRLQLMLNKLIKPHSASNTNSFRMGILLLVCLEEQHTIGPIIIADQSRRKGHSVKLLLGSTQEEIYRTCANQKFAIIMLSCAGHHSLKTAKATIQLIRNAITKPPPIILGGQILERDLQSATLVGADHVSNDLEFVLKYAAQHDEH